MKSAPSERADQDEALHRSDRHPRGRLSGSPSETGRVAARLRATAVLLVFQAPSIFGEFVAIWKSCRQWRRCEIHSFHFALRQRAETGLSMAVRSEETFPLRTSPPASFVNFLSARRRSVRRFPGHVAATGPGVFRRRSSGSRTAVRRPTHGRERPTRLRQSINLGLRPWRRRGSPRDRVRSGNGGAVFSSAPAAASGAGAESWDLPRSSFTSSSDSHQ